MGFASEPDASLWQAILADDAYCKALARERARHRRRIAELRRSRTQDVVDRMAQTTPESRLAAARARAAAVHAQIDEIAAQSDLDEAQAAFTCNAPTAVPADLLDIRIDDLATLFTNRERLLLWLRVRIKKIHAKIHWQTKAGTKAYFNVAAHKNHIPIDRALTILAHLISIDDGSGQSLDPWVDSVIECGLYAKVKAGKFQYQRRCQDGDHCELCNYLNISDGLKAR